MHPGAGKEDVQDLLNKVQWQALVIKQSRPKQWIVAAQDVPPRDTIPTEHGCILVLPCVAPEKGARKGKGKGNEGKHPQWLLGSHPSYARSDKSSEPSTASHHAPGSGDMHGPVQKAVLEVEQKMEERFALMREETATATALMKKDLANMRDEFKEHVVEQKRESRQLAERVNSVESNLAGQLTTFMNTLNATLLQQSQELTGKIAEGQQNLRAELSHEFRQHVGNVRKRTPPPSEGEAEGDKRPRE